MDISGRRRPSQEQLARAFLGLWAMIVILIMTAFVMTEGEFVARVISRVADLFVARRCCGSMCLPWGYGRTPF